MAEVPSRHEPTVAQVDRLIDENGAPIEIPEDSELKLTHAVEESVGGTGPTAWWRAGLIALAIVVVMLLAFQLLLGKTGIDMVPGTPTAATQPAQP
ncbi:hypothetical protein [Devosia sp.]|uniref:hypothetical protein n=1 Tax=Devosia sp. TaxID=1871048 RepID=UPI001AC6E5BD|nr:hypothetical protein [Devosia sp.]MBN9311389.1 hypothetical protein [Devosia sp.]